MEIATRWNLDDKGSGYSGFVTKFEIDKNYISQFEIQNVGGPKHNELWIPAEELENFNKQIQGNISITKQFFGAQYKGSTNVALNNILEK